MYRSNTFLSWGYFFVYLPRITLTSANSTPTRKRFQKNFEVKFRNTQARFSPKSYNDISVATAKLPSHTQTCFSNSARV